MLKIKTKESYKETGIKNDLEKVQVNRHKQNLKILPKKY